jgi:hypothetical protein
MDTEKILSDIALAFPVHPHPNTFHEEGRPAGYMALDLETSFKDKDWSMVSLDDWRNSPGATFAMSCLTTEAFSYYVPSALTVSLKNPDFFEYGVDCLTPHNKKREPRGAKWYAFYRGFNEAQRRCIIDFLKVGTVLFEKLDSRNYESEIALAIWNPTQTTT